MPYPESQKSRSDAARKPAPASPGLDFLHSLAMSRFGPEAGKEGEVFGSSPR